MPGTKHFRNIVLQFIKIDQKRRGSNFTFVTFDNIGYNHTPERRVAFLPVTSAAAHKAGF